MTAALRVCGGNKVGTEHTSVRGFQPTRFELRLGGISRGGTQPYSALAA